MTLQCSTFFSVDFALGLWLCSQILLRHCPWRNFQNKPVLGDALTQVSPFYRESALRTLQNAHSCREEVRHDEGKLFAMYPKKFLRFPRSIVLCSSTFPLLRRPRSTIILLCIIWLWRLHKFPRSIVTWNRFFRILISIRGPPWVCRSWRRHERRRSCGQIHHGSWFGCDTSFSWFLLRSFCHRSDANCGTEMADIKQGQEMIPFITCETALSSKCLRIGSWCQCIWFGSWGPE